MRPVGWSWTATRTRPAPFCGLGRPPSGAHVAHWGERCLSSPRREPWGACHRAEWYGSRVVVVVSRWEPSSRTCSGCGWYHVDMELKDRIFVCHNPARPECGLVLGRDLNAGLNLAKCATCADLAQLAGSSSESQNACGEESAGRRRVAALKLSSLKQEPNTFLPVRNRTVSFGERSNTVVRPRCSPVTSEAYLGFWLSAPGFRHG
jgi:hypothetical protein